MLLTRLFDDRMLRTQRQGKLSFYMKSTGEEAVSVAAGMALQPGDMLFPSYRKQGLQVVRGRPLVDLMCQLLSNTHDMCKGRQLPVMYHSATGQPVLDLRQPRDAVPAGRRLGHGGGDQGRGPHRATWIGEGSKRRGRLPPRAAVRLGVPRAGASSTSSTTSGRSRPSRASPAASSAPSRRAARATACRACASTATTSSRSTPPRGGRPSARAPAAARTLIELVTYRAAAHSTSDDPSRYRPKDEAEPGRSATRSSASSST